METEDSPDEIDGLPDDLGKSILSATRTYAPILKQIFTSVDLNSIGGIIHCSGGAQTKVMKYVNNVHVIKDDLFDIPVLFDIIQKDSKTDWKEMYQVFNMGHRLELYCNAGIADEIISISKSFNVDAKIIGRVETSDRNQLTIRHKRNIHLQLSNRKMSNNIQTADLYDDHGDNLSVALPLFKFFGQKRYFHGKVVTIKCHEDNSLVRETLGEDGSGKVMVVDGGGSLRCALVGDRLAQKAIDNGWEGIIVYGCIRDSMIIDKMNIGIKCLNTNPTKSIKRGVGLKNEVVRFASVLIRPGHYVYADEDGIVFSEKELM